MNTKSFSINRNKSIDLLSVRYARKALETIYGPESHYFDHNGSSLDLENCIDMDWKGFRVAVRGRPDQFDKYKYDIRIRTATRQGMNKSEWEKLQIVKPRPDIYVFTYANETTEYGWHMIDVSKLVNGMANNIIKYQQINLYNTSIYDELCSFRVIDVRNHPEMVFASSIDGVVCGASVPKLPVG